MEGPLRQFIRLRHLFPAKPQHPRGGSREPTHTRCSNLQMLTLERSPSLIPKINFVLTTTKNLIDHLSRIFFGVLFISCVYPQLFLHLKEPGWQDFHNSHHPFLWCIPSILKLVWNAKPHLSCVLFDSYVQILLGLNKGKAKPEEAC